PQDGFNLARNAIYTQFQDVDKEMISPEIRALAVKVSSDPNLPADLRQKYTVAWNLCEELRSYVESPTGNRNLYINKSRELAMRLRNEVRPFVTGLGFDPRGDTDPD